MPPSNGIPEREIGGWRREGGMTKKDEYRTR
jgi:hypothetical protein